MNIGQRQFHLSICTLWVVLLLLFQALPANAKTMADRSLPIAANVPSTVSDGTAFSCTLSGSNIASVTFTFLERSLTAKAAPLPHTRGGRSIHAATVLMPVPLDQPQGPQNLSWCITFTDGSIKNGSASIFVTLKEYPVQKLTVEPKYVTPDPELKERIQRESSMLHAALNTVSPEKHWKLPLKRPVPGVVTSLFGLRRVLNGEPKGVHRGLDFNGKTGDPITAIADGKVILTGDFYYPGKFVLIDHGLGVISISMHMSAIRAKTGHFVKRGDRIGHIGATGRSTGPHLHLGFYVLGQGVDVQPLLAPPSKSKPTLAKTKTVSSAPKKGGQKATNRSQSKKR